MKSLEESVTIMRRLRAADGCPWDREQTMHSLQRYTLEEVYEVFDAIDREVWPEIQDELGDLLLQVLFYAQIAKDAGHFDIEDVASGLNSKLVRRHPHVFGDVRAVKADDVLGVWEAVKQEERRARPAKAEASGVLDDVPRSLPAILEATKLSSRAAKVGFDWPGADGMLAKLEEEIHELREEMAAAAANQPAELEAELGDVLFTVVNVARHLGVDAETALRATNRKFRRRFAAMEEVHEGERDQLSTLSTEDWEELWQWAKDRELPRR